MPLQSSSLRSQRVGPPVGTGTAVTAFPLPTSHVGLSFQMETTHLRWPHWRDTTLFWNVPSAKTRNGRPSCPPLLSLRTGHRARSGEGEGNPAPRTCLQRVNFQSSRKKTSAQTLPSSADKAGFCTDHCPAALQDLTLYQFCGKRPSSLQGKIH